MLPEHAPAVRGHRPMYHGAGNWRCVCGKQLSDGPLGNGQRGARDMMRYHRLDLYLLREAQQK